MLEPVAGGGGVAAVVARPSTEAAPTEQPGYSISAVSARPRHLQHTIAKQAADSILWTQSVQVHDNVTT